MSDIKEGDLVMIVKPINCCGSSNSVGKIRTVIGVSKDISFCPYCHFVLPKALLVHLSSGSYVHLNRLKKIPPLSDLEVVETHSKDLIPNKKETIGEMA
jgi:hypothetical protein